MDITSDTQGSEEQDSSCASEHVNQGSDIIPSKNSNAASDDESTSECFVIDER